jgi:hypothetical protein
MVSKSFLLAVHPTVISTVNSILVKKNDFENATSCSNFTIEAKFLFEE